MGHGERVLGAGPLAVVKRGVGGARLMERDGGCSDGQVEVAEWLSLSGGKRAGGPSVVELVRQRLVEHEVLDGLGLGGIEGGRLIQEVSLGWAIPVYERGVLYAALLGGGLAVVESAEVRNAIATVETGARQNGSV